MLKTRILFRLILLIGGAIFVLLPDDAAAMEGRLIFPLQGKHVHSSSIVECPNGDLIAVWFHGSGERSANDVQIQGSRLKNGETKWGEVFVAADTHDLPDCNPVVFLDGRQRLWLIWIVVRANRWEQSILKYRISEDFEGEGGANWTWQDIILLKPGDDFGTKMHEGFRNLGYDQEMWAEYARPYDEMLIEAADDPVKRSTGWMTRAQPLRIALDGDKHRILLPLYSDGYNISLIGITDDDGDTWRASGPMIGLGNVQPSLIQRKDGMIVAYQRDGGGRPKRVLRSESTDNGESWTLAKDTELPNPGSSLAALGLSDGRWAMALNDTENGRHQMAIIVSSDEGESWSDPKYLDKAEPGDGNFGYPTMIQGASGTVHVTYSYNNNQGAAIKHVNFEPSWLDPPATE